MVIGFDIDYTVTNPFKVELAIAKDFLKAHRVNADNIIYPDEFSIIKKFGGSDKLADKFWSFFGTIILKHTAPRINAVSTIKKLKEQGHEIIFITARGDNDFFRDDNPYVLTFNWLKRNGFVFDKLVCRDSKKLQSCLRNNIDLFIDDSIDVINNLTSGGVNAVLIEAPHNKKYKNSLPQNCEYIKDISEVVGIANRKALIECECEK